MHGKVNTNRIEYNNHSNQVNENHIQYRSSQYNFGLGFSPSRRVDILQNISAKQSKSMHPLRIQYSMQIAFNTFSVARFRTQVNPCKSDYNPTRLFAFKTIPHSEYAFNTGQCKSECIQYRNPSQINTHTFSLSIQYAIRYNTMNNHRILIKSIQLRARVPSTFSHTIQVKSERCFRNQYSGLKSWRGFRRRFRIQCNPQVNASNTQATSIHKGVRTSQYEVFTFKSIQLVVVAVIHTKISLATPAAKRLVRGLGGLARFGLMLGSVSLVRVRDVYAVEGDMESTFNTSDQSGLEYKIPGIDCFV